MKVLSTVLLVAFAVWLASEFKTRNQIKTHVNWSEPNFELLIKSLAECGTHADKYPDDCGRHEEARRTVITA